MVLPVFVLREQRAFYPLVDLSLFRIRAFLTGQLSGLFATMALGTLSFIMPFYWQAIRGYSAQEAGLMILPLPLSIMLIAPQAGRLSDRWGVRGISTAGLGTLAVGMALLTQVTADMAVWNVLLRFSLVGIGLSLFFAPNNNGVMSAAPPERRGIAAGLLGMGRYTGQSISIAMAGTMFALFATSGAINLEHLPSPAEVEALHNDPAALQELQSAFVNGMRAAFTVAIPLTLLAMIMSWLRGNDWNEPAR